jgi:hypothetical protein
MSNSLRKYSCATDAAVRIGFGFMLADGDGGFGFEVVFLRGVAPLAPLRIDAERLDCRTGGVACLSWFVGLLDVDEAYRYGFGVGLRGVISDERERGVEAAVSIDMRAGAAVDTVGRSSRSMDGIGISWSILNLTARDCCEG